MPPAPLSPLSRSRCEVEEDEAPPLLSRCPVVADDEERVSGLLDEPVSNEARLSREVGLPDSFWLDADDPREASCVSVDELPRWTFTLPDPLTVPEPPGLPAPVALLLEPLDELGALLLLSLSPQPDNASSTDAAITPVENLLNMSAPL